MNLDVLDRVVVLLPGELFSVDLMQEAFTIVNCEAQVAIHSGPNTAEINAIGSGNFYTTGESPCKPDDNGVARLGVAWFTDHLGKKHVRLKGDVIRTTKYGSTSMWQQDQPMHRLVYPNSWLETRLSITCYCGKKGVLEEIGWDGTKCRSCRDREQYERDTGFKAGR